MQDLQSCTHIAEADAVTAEEVSRCGLGTRLWQNALAMLSPLL